LSDKLTAAKSLASRGFKVFPLVPGGKTPAIKEWPDKATTDPAQIERWWGPDSLGWDRDYNIGVLTGNGLVVLDIDCKNGVDGFQSLTKLEFLYDDLPPTFTVSTPRSGSHRYFNFPRDQIPRNSHGELAPGLDTKGDRGFAVGPGSTINGVEYRVTNDAPLAQCPVFLRDFCIRKSDRTGLGGPMAVRDSFRIELDTPDAISRATQYLQSAEPAIEGAGGDHHTVATARRTADFGVSEQTALDLMLAHWNERCSPPWSPDDLKTKVHNGFTYRDDPVGIASPQFEFEPVPIAQSQKLYFELYESIEPDRNSIPLIESYLEQHAFSVTYGESNTGKTFVALDMAFHIATGRPWNGMSVEQGAVVYIAAEGGKGIRKRIAALKKHHGVDKAPIAVVPCSINLLGRNSDATALIALIDQAALAMTQPVKLVVIDTLARAMSGGNENASEDMGNLVRAADKIRAGSGAHVMMIHHSGKDASKGSRGHSSLRAATDTEFEIADGRLHVKKQRDEDYAESRPFVLKTVDLGVNSRGKAITSCVVAWPGADGDFEAVSLTPDERRCMDALQAVSGEGGVGNQSVASAYEGLGLPVPPARVVHKWLTALETKGLVTRHGATRNTTWRVKE
jgi:hypothetical protein